MRYSSLRFERPPALLSRKQILMPMAVGHGWVPVDEQGGLRVILRSGFASVAL